MTVRLRQTSPLLRSPLFTGAANTAWWGLGDWPIIEASVYDEELVVAESDWWDTLAEQAYGDRTLGAVLAHANGVEFPAAKPATGLIIRVPPRSNLGV